MLVARQWPPDPWLILPSSTCSQPRSGHLSVKAESVSRASGGDWCTASAEGPQCDTEPGKWSGQLERGGSVIAPKSYGGLCTKGEARISRPSLIFKDHL